MWLYTAAYVRTPSALTWLRVNHLIHGLHKQISYKNCLYTVNSYFMIATVVWKYLDGKNFVGNDINEKFLNKNFKHD